jgi:hypothetical protein
VTDAVTDLVAMLAADPSAEVRHKAVAALARFAGRDSRAGQAIVHVAQRDPDPAVRHVAQAHAGCGQHHVVRRKRALRAVKRTAEA